MPEEQMLLCVDDEESVLSALRRLLRKEDYRMLVATSGEEALQLLEREDVEVQVVLADNRMPGMTGTEFLQQVKQRHPDTVRMMLSGYADPFAVLESINKGEVYRFLPKPWSDEELKVVVRQCFEHHHLMQQNRSLVEQVRLQNEALKQWNENLEQMVNERTRTLRFSQEVLEKLPVPVLGVSREGTIALVNSAASALLAPAHPFPLGCLMDECLPPPIAEAARSCLDAGEPVSSDVEMAGDAFSLHAAPLHNGGGVRGCILLFFSPTS